MSSARRSKRAHTRILAIDLGGTHVKILLDGATQPREATSGPKMTPAQFVRTVRELARGWRYEAISLGFPGVVLHGRPVAEPHNLGRGWVGFQYSRAFGCPVRIVNDATMQAIGSYEGGRMLFLGLGTGLGSTLIIDGVVESTELAHLPYKKGRTYEDYAGERGLERLGHKKWRRAVADICERLGAAFEIDYIVLGGGNARRLKKLPVNVRLGSNANAFAGGFRIWSDPHWTMSTATSQQEPIRKRRA
jgi:polyphosphate glucokinase